MRRAKPPYRLKSEKAIIRKASVPHHCDSPSCTRRIERGEHYVVYDGGWGRRYFHLEPCAVSMRLAERVGVQ